MIAHTTFGASAVIIDDTVHVPDRLRRRRTGTRRWSIKKFVRTARRYRTVQIKAGSQILTAADPLSDDLNEALTKIGSHIEH